MRMIYVLIFVSFVLVLEVRAAIICLRNNLYADVTVVSSCLVSADIRGLGPQQPEITWLTKSRAVDLERSFSSL